MLEGYVIGLKNKVFIHLGLQKTGTTWIQLELFKKMNVFYTQDTRIESYIPDDMKVVISAEWLAGIPYWNHIPCMRYLILDKLKKLYPNARIIVGFRDKHEWIQSIYSQYIKNGGCLSYRIWLKFCFNNEYLDFDGYKKQIEKLFKKVYVYDFNDLKTDIDGFAKNLCGFIGEPIPDYNYKVYNKKFTDNKLMVMRFVNMWFKSNENPSGFFPKTFGSLERYLIKKISGSWQ